MNNQRRKEINDISKELAPLREELDNLLGRFNEIQDAIESIKDEEQEAFDNMPEGLQMSDRGQVAEQVVENLDGAFLNIDEVVEILGAALRSIEQANENLTVAAE